MKKGRTAMDIGFVGSPDEDVAAQILTPLQKSCLRDETCVRHPEHPQAPQFEARHEAAVIGFAVGIPISGIQGGQSGRAQITT